MTALFRLSGRTAWVTGSGADLGRDIALTLGRAGARVAVTSREGEPPVLVSAELRAAGAEALAVAGDVSDPSQVSALVDEIGLHLGPIDLLVTIPAAAEGAGRPPADPERGAWEAAVASGLRGPMLCCHAVLPGMIAAGRGHVFHIGAPQDRTQAGGSAAGAAAAAFVRLTGRLDAALQNTGVAIYDLPSGRHIAEVIVGLAAGTGTARPERVAAAEIRPTARLTAIR